MVNQAAIANQFRRYLHRVPYVWAGASPRGWDCSGAVNYVTCHDMGYDIPGYRGGSFSGSTHGPNTYSWLAWGGVYEIPRSSTRNGTYVIWPSHMGIAVGPNYYISAFDTELGTVIEPIHGGGPYGETARFFNLRQGGSSGGTGGGVPHGPIPGGNPTSGTQWNQMQANWNLLRYTLGQFSRNTNKQVDVIAGRMKRIKSR
jgi:cell wall-associated NlpC family hydrolase